MNVPTWYDFSLMIISSSLLNTGVSVKAVLERLRDGNLAHQTERFLNDLDLSHMFIR